MGNLLATVQDNGALDVLEEQAKNQVAIVREMKRVANEVFEMKNEVNDMKKEISEDIKELRDNIKLTTQEERAIQSHVGKRSHELAQAYFGRTVSTDLYMAKVGHFRTAIYQRIKETFNVPRYNELRRVDFDNAMKVIDIVNLNNLRNHQLRLTGRQKDIARKNGDDITLFDLEN